MPLSHRFRITDDSGFLALVDHHAYQGFVAAEWTYESVLRHFRAAMVDRSLLLWGTGREEDWTVELLVGGAAPATGFRRVTGPIRVSAGELHLTNYESLTMVAQFADERLPEAHLRDLVVDLPTGEYHCEIVQLADPDDESRSVPDFVIALNVGRAGDAWSDPPWHDH